MSQQFYTQGLQSAYGTPPVLPLTCALPFGGQRGSGAPFPQGQAIGVISTTPANEVRTLSLASTPSGTVTLTWAFASGVYQCSFAYNATMTAVLAAVVAQIPGWGDGNLAVSGSAGSSYVFTFGGQLASVAIGGNWTAAITSGTATWATTTPGSSACQYDIYNQSTNNDVDGFLQFDVATDPTGARLSEIGGVATGQPAPAQFFMKGVFRATDLLGLDSNAFTLGKLTKRAGGTLVEI